MEVIDIDLDQIPSSGSANFGSGIELLMNEKKKSSSTRIDLAELDTLEKELNDLSNPHKNEESTTKNLSGLSGFSNMFNFSSPVNPSDTKVGVATKETVQGTRTWDGFTKVGEDIPKTERATNLSDREKRRKKREMLKKLDQWQDKGFLKNNTTFTMDSSYEDIEDEYEGALEDKRRRDGIKLQGWWFTTVINTLEYGNALLNPFDLNLDGWGEQVSEDLDSYEEIFSELHDKYKGGKMAPEVSLLLRIGFSAAVVNMSNKMLSSATPGFGEVMKQSPELMKMFTTAAVDTMSKQNSAFDFAKTMMNPPEQVNVNMGPPPPPMETKSQPPTRPVMQFTQRQERSELNSRPDLAAAGNMFRESGIELTGPSNFSNPPTSIPRAEMKGPQNVDIEQLLSGLKTKPREPDPISGSNSMISVSSLHDLENVQMPKKTRRRPNKSDKNTVSLDL